MIEGTSDKTDDVAMAPSEVAQLAEGEGSTENTPSADETIERAKNEVVEQERELELTKEKLKECQKENENLRQREVPVGDLLESESVRKLAAEYQGQIKKLKAELNCIKSGNNTKQLADENKQLMTRNHIFRTTNAGLHQKIADLTAKLEATKITPQLQGIPSISNAQSVSQPLMSERMEVASVEQCKEYLQEYYSMVTSLQKEKTLMLQKIQNDSKTILEQQKSFAKLDEHMQAVVMERDKLQAEQCNRPQTAEKYLLRRTVSEGRVEELQNENKELRHRLSYNNDHIKEQEERIEKLMLRCTEAETTEKSCPLPSGSQQDVNVEKELECMQDLLMKRNEEITELNKMVTIYKSELDKAKKEVEELKIAANPETNVYNAQLKAFQDDWLEEHKEKQSIIEKSKQLEEANKTLRLELEQQQRTAQQQHSNHHFSSSNGPGPSSFAMSPPTHAGTRQPFDYAQPHRQVATVPHVQRAGLNSGIPSYQPSYSHPSYMRANTIPPRDSGGHPPMPSYDRSMSNNQYGAGYGYPPDQQPQYYHVQTYNADVSPTMYGNDPHNPSLQPRMPGPGPGPQNRGQPLSKQNRPAPR